MHPRLEQRELRAPGYATRARLLLLTFTAAAALTAIDPGPGPAAAQAQAAPDSADEVVFWTNLDNLTGLSDPQLDAYASMGVDAFVMSTRQLRGLGGSQEWTSDPSADLSAPRYSFQRKIRDSAIVDRAATRGIDLYLGFYAVNYFNPSTPYVDWFDDLAWNETAKTIGDLSGAARMLGFRGLAIDQELYPQEGGTESATWDWSYPGNTHNEAEVRRKVKRRGRQVMTAILDGFPGVEIGVYNFLQPGSWANVTYDIHSDGAWANLYDRRVDLDFWNGMTAVEGWRAIRQWNNVFYKTYFYGNGDSQRLKWENAMLWDVSQTAALLSRRFDNWDYARSRYYSSPFSWINAGPSAGTYDDPKPVPYVETQLTAMQKWGMGGGFANYHYGSNFDPGQYAPYANAIRAASEPRSVDSQPPVIEVAGASSRISGAATDDTAIWAVHWRDDRGGTGTAKLTFNVNAGNRLDVQDWRMDWAVPVADLTNGSSAVTVTAEDIKGKLSAPAVISLKNGAGRRPGKRAPRPRIERKPPEATGGRESSERRRS